MEFKRFTKTYPPSDNATIVQQVVFASLLERGFQFVSINDEEKAFQSATSGAFPEISLVHISSKNIISNVVVRSMVVGGNLLVYERTKNKNFARDDYKSIIIERVRVKKEQIEVEENKTFYKNQQLLKSIST